MHTVHTYKCNKICIFSLCNSFPLLPPYSKKNGIEYLEGPFLVSNDELGYINLGLYCRQRF